MTCVDAVRSNCGRVWWAPLLQFGESSHSIFWDKSKNLYTFAIQPEYTAWIFYVCILHVRYVALLWAFQIHKHSWLLDQLGDSLNQFAVELQKLVKLSFSISDHIGRSSQFHTWPRMVIIILSTYSTLIVTHVFLVSILHYKPCHIPLNCKCLIKKNDHKPTYLSNRGQLPK